MRSILLSLAFAGIFTACGGDAEKSNNQPSRANEASELSCTCHGGPGNYPYQCAPIQTTCYGGPGNYPYQCSICPQG